MFNYQSFVDAVESYNSGTWTPERTVTWVQAAYDFVGEEGERVRRMLDETGYQEESPAEVEAGLSGIEAYRDGLERLWDYLESGQPQDLEGALEAARQGQSSLRKAWQLNLDKSEELAFTTVG
jgi:hypothetical protein